MKPYKKVVNYILTKGVMTPPTRTGSRTLVAHPLQMHHDLANGFPLLTTRKLNFNAIAVELDGFLKGITDKKWYQDNGCSFWNEWANKRIVNGKLKMCDDKSKEMEKQIQREERDIFSGYGWEWRHFGATYRGYEYDYTGQGVDQLAEIVDSFKENPVDRQLIMNAWNPVNKKEYALPPCILLYQFYSHEGKKLNLSYYQRSCDLALGGANDFPSNALLLTLVARAANMEPGVLTAELAIPHIYEQHIEKISDQMKRSEYPLPKLELETGIDCFNFDYKKAKISNYIHHPHISYERNV